MYDYKRYHFWLMIVSFWALHVVGAKSILKNHDLFAFNRCRLCINKYDQYNQNNKCEDAFSDFCAIGLRSKHNTSFFSNIINEVSQNNILAQEIILSDNRIDKIDKKYSEYLCASNVKIEGNQFFSIV